jgi:ribosomal protein L11 methyltransferase
MNIKHQNWNEVWESNFEPVFIENSLSIVAPFHDASNRKNHVIEIDPKMSFGTGHHQTTYLMCQEILSLVLEGKSILDMGTGTGVLAILAEQLGAKQCIAIDIESWSVENTKSNALRNGCSKIIALEGGVSIIPPMQYDFIFANINKNVLKEQMSTYALNLPLDGILLLSGFFVTDVDELVLLAKELGLSNVGIREKENWALIKLKKTTMV